jgi:hypothetical protein
MLHLPVKGLSGRIVGVQNNEKIITLTYVNHSSQQNYFKVLLQLACKLKRGG